MAAFDKAHAKHPHAKEETRRYINALGDQPTKGTRCTYIDNTVDIYKIRSPLKSYSIGTSNGMRCLYIAFSCVIPIFIYKKGTMKEQDVLKSTKANLRAIMQEIDDLQKSSNKMPD